MSRARVVTTVGAVAVLSGCALAAGGAAVPVVALVALATVGWVASTLAGGVRGTTVLVVALLARAVFLASPAVSDDVHRYVFEGRIQLAGWSPYAHAPSDPALAAHRGVHHERINHPDLPTIYPPATQAVFALGAALSLDERGLRDLVLVLDMVVVLVLLAWLRATRRPPSLAIAYAWSPLAIGAAALGHADAIMLVPLVGFFWAAERRAFHAAGALLGLAILGKLVAVLLVPWLFLRSPRAVLLVVLPVLLLGYAPYFAGGNLLGSAPEFARDYAFNGSLARLAEALLPTGTDRMALAACLLAVVALISVAEPRPARAAVWVFGALLALSPTVHVWYATWFLVGVAAFGREPLRLPFMAWAAGTVFVIPVYVRAATGSAFQESFAATAIGYALPALVAMILLVIRWPHRAPLVSLDERTAPPTPANAVSFSVVIPARGERANLESLLPAWAATQATEIWVADTPTGDGTESLALRTPRARYLGVREQGYGAAVAEAWHRIRGVEVIVICDADYAEGPRRVAELLRPFSDGRVGLVTGARVGRGLSGPQRLGNWIASAGIALFWQRRFHDLGPFRAVRREALAVEALRDRGYGWNVEMNVRTLERGYRVVEVAVPVSRRSHGTDRISSSLRGIVGAGRGILGALVRLRQGPAARIVILTKLPGFAPVKTRLAKHLGVDGARRAYDLMLRDTIRLARVVDPLPIVAFSPATADPARAVPGAVGCEFRPVTGDDGATCLERSLEESFDGRPLIALGGDVPDLPADHLWGVVTALTSPGGPDAVLVPTGDGGFSALGLRRPFRGLARALRFGAQDSMSPVEEVLRRAGRSVVVTAPWPDVDTPAQYEAYLARKAAAADGEVFCPTELHELRTALVGENES